MNASVILVLLGYFFIKVFFVTNNTEKSLPLSYN